MPNSVPTQPRQLKRPRLPQPRAATSKRIIKARSRVTTSGFLDQRGTEPMAYTVHAPITLMMMFEKNTGRRFGNAEKKVGASFGESLECSANLSKKERPLGVEVHKQVMSSRDS